MNLYWKHLSVIKTNEGVYFTKVHDSLKVCFRLIPFFLGFLYEYHSFFCDTIKIPDEIKDMLS